MTPGTVRSVLGLLAWAAVVSAPAAHGQDPAASSPAGPAAEWDTVLAWPEPQRAFLQDGPGWLLDGGQIVVLLAMDEAARERWIEEFLAQDPVPETPDNELATAIAARRSAITAEFATPSDVRARLLFLHGAPTERLILDCGQAFQPIEIWSWGGDPDRQQRTGSVDAVLVYRSAAGAPWRLWIPQHGKRVLYTSDMVHWLEDWEELTGSGLMRARRFDLQVCRQAHRVDRVTGVRGLADAERTRPRAEDYEIFLAPPADLGAWARQAAASAPPASGPAAGPLAVSDLRVRFPRRDGQRLVSRLVVELAPGAAEPAVRTGRVGAGGAAWDAAFGEEEGAEGEAEPQSQKGEAAVPDAAGPATAGAAEPAGDAIDPPPDPAADPAVDPAADPAAGPAADPAADPAAEHELRLVVEGLVERDGGVHETFRVRFRPDAPAEETPVALVVDRLLRPNASYLVRLTVRDEVSGRSGRVVRAFRVPAEARPEEAVAASEDVVVALGEDLAREPIAGADHLLLVPPEETVVLGLWRAEALVSGTRIARVDFLVDGEVQLRRSRPPYTAELRLDRFPREQVIGAAGYDADGELVAADEVVVNQPRGQLRVRIVEPARGLRAAGRLTARAEVTVPDGRRVERVELEVNDETVAVLERPPWEAVIEVPAGGGLVYLSATAWLDDGRQAEDVRILNAPGYMEEVDVSLVELYVAAVDRGNLPVPGLSVGDFRVLEDGRPQEIRRFEEVEDLPLAVGMVIDTSGSMQDSLAEAQRAAEGFLRSVVRPGDTAFAVAFSSRPVLLVPPTDDVDAVADALSGLRADGWTVLHDALVTSLYYFRGIEGQKALVLLSDGDDTTSVVPFEDALEYARRMNTAVYAIGLGVGRLDLPVRRKLEELARSTGGRSFFISEAAELEGIYEVIEKELRSRYLLAYSSDRARGEGEDFREVEVEVARPGVTGRTIRGYYP